MDLCFNTPATLNLAIVYFVVKLIKVVTMEEVNLYLKIPGNINISIVEEALTVTGEAGIGLRPDTIPPITQLGMLECWVALLILVLFTKVFMVMKEVEIGIIPDTLIPITMADNRGPHRGTLNMIYLGWSSINNPKQSPRLLFLST